MEGDQLCEHNQRGRLSCSYYAYWGNMLPGEGLVVCFYQFLGHPLILEGDQLCVHNQRGRLSRSYYAYQGKISLSRCKEISVDHAHRHNSDLPLPKCQLVCAVMT